MNDRIKLEQDGGVAVVTLNRPDKMNALDMAMFEAIDETINTLAADETVRAVVLTGEGHAFCAGLDVASFASDPSVIGHLMMVPDGETLNLVQRVALGWRRLRVPVIAALHGETFGGGLQIALGADIRYAAPDARLSVMEIRWGIIPDMGASQTLRELVSYDVACELTFSGRIVDGAEAVRVGLATRLTETPVIDAREMAESIAQRSPDAIVAARHLLKTTWHGSEAEGLAMERNLQAQLLGRPNQMEAARANFEKRDPDFAPPSVSLDV